MLRGENNGMIRAACFDLDGTLVDTEHIWSRATGNYLSELGCAMDPAELDRLVYGHAWSLIYARLASLFPEIFARRPIQTAAAELQLHYERLRDDPASIIIPSSLEFFKKTAAQMPVTIVSGSPRGAIRECLELMGVAHLVPFYIGSEDYAQGKPDPTCYLLAAQQFNLPPGECAAIEDSSAGVRSAKAAGMYCVALQRLHDGPIQDVQDADVVVSDLNAWEFPMFNREVRTGN